MDSNMECENSEKLSNHETVLSKSNENCLEKNSCKSVKEILSAMSNNKVSKSNNEVSESNNEVSKSNNEVSESDNEVTKSNDGVSESINEDENTTDSRLSSKSIDSERELPISSVNEKGESCVSYNQNTLTSSPSDRNSPENGKSIGSSDDDDTNQRISITENESIEVDPPVREEAQNGSNINGESNDGTRESEQSTSRNQKDNEENISDEVENQGKITDDENSSYGDEGIKIQMVTTLGSSDTFVEPPTGPVSPTQAMPNPLDSDKEETNDSVKGDTVVNKDNQLVDKNSSLTEPVQILDGDKTSEADKDGDQVEVITGDKTISRECFQKMKTGLPLVISSDHGYSRKANGSQPDGAKKHGLKVIYPKKKSHDATQVKITKIPNPLLKTCLQCSKVSNCSILVDISGSECYLCSEECLKQHRTAQQITLCRKRSPSVPVDKQDISSESRLCVNCDTNVSILPEDKILSWETMEFCNEDCLGKYQLKMWSFCSACKKDVPTSSMGKYCVRFGHEVKQFCSSSCLEEFKKGIKVCSYCQKDLSDGEGFLAPIGEKGNFKDFCSQLCLDDYDSMSRNLPSQLKVEPCGVCDKTALVQLQVVTSNNCVNLCSEVCFAAFKFVNSAISSAPCYLCKKHYEKTLPTCVTIFYENDLLSFCSKSCMNVNILAKRKIVACSWCKVKKYNFDMIRRKSSSGAPTNWCSVNCMTLYQVSLNAINLRSKTNCSNCNKLDVPNFHLTMSDATVRNFCSLECVNKFQATFPNQGASTNGVFPTDNVNQTPVSSTLPIIPLKKPDIKVIAPNGPLTSGPMSPSPQTSGTLQIKHQLLVLPQQPPEIMNAQVQVKPYMISKSVSVKTNQSTKSVQTEKEEKEKLDLEGPILVPVPVPIYVPCPMAMYSIPVPTPVPVPIPIPIPVFIPTTKGTAEEILADIKRIQDKIPGNPIEAELLMMAEMAEGEKSREADLERSSLPETTVGEKRTGQKRPVSSSDEQENSERIDGPPEKKRREDGSTCAVGETIEGAIIHQLSTSRLNLSLKETLGVSAWKHYAAEIGEQRNLLEMRAGELAQALRGFILNAKIPGDGHYTPDQKYYLMLGIQYYLEENGRIDNIFLDTLFDPFIDALNEEAKKFQNMFLQCGNVVTRVEEEHLWESKQLGPHSPSILLATLIYFNTKYFNLTTVEEHMQLSFSHIMKHWKRNPNSSPGSNSANGSRNILLRFYTPQSVLDANSQKKKVYEQEANDEDPYRCPIQLYDFYISKCPEIVKSKNDLFYMSPERSVVADSPIWYSTLPLSSEVIERTLNRFKMVKEINLALLSSV